jgi:hypothetical protein
LPALSAWWGQLRDATLNLPPLVAHAERRYALQASRELLTSYERESREHPELSRRELYQAVVAARIGQEPHTAAQIVRRAEESFTDWPVERELRFRHVAHYQIFTEFTRSTAVRQGTRTNIGAAVARVIPEEI